MFTRVIPLIISAFVIFQTSAPISPTFTAQWLDGGVGAGGDVTQLIAYPDGTKIVRTDTNNYYLWNNASPWTALPTPASLPSGFLDTYLSSQHSGQYPSGGSEIVACAYDNNSTPTTSLTGSASIIYMLLSGGTGGTYAQILVSTDKGAHWTNTGQTITSNGGNDGTIKAYSPYAWCDPASSGQIAYMSQPTGALLVTANGGTTWSSVGGGLPAATGGAGTQIVGDPNSPVVIGVTQTLYAWVQGSGLYTSTNGGAAWSAVTTTGAPTALNKLYIDKFSQVWVASTTGNIYKFASGAWTTITPTGSPGAGYLVNIAFDPTSTATSTQRIAVVFQYQNVAISTNGGATWTETSGSHISLSGDIPWLKTTYQPYINAQTAEFDLSGNLYISAGFGAWYSTSAAWSTWIIQSSGIEQLVVNREISPPGIGPTVAGWDQGVFGNMIPGTPAANNYLKASTNLQGAWDVAYAPATPGTMAAVINGESGGDASGISTDGGYTWTPFVALPNGTTQAGGMIAVGTPTNIIDVPGQGQALYCTTDGGGTWALAILPGSPASHWLTNYTYGRHVLTADYVSAGVFYAYNDTDGVYSSSGGCGGTWTKVYSGYIDSAHGSGYGARMEAVPGEAGNLFYTSGNISCGASPPEPCTTELLYRSTNGGATWSSLANIADAGAVGFGAAKPGGGGYPAIYFDGWYKVGGVTWTYGVWQSVDNAATWTQITPWAVSIGSAADLTGDPDVYGRIYKAATGSGYSFYDTSDACPSVAWLASTIKPGSNVTGTVTLTAQGSGLVPVTSVEFDVDGSSIQTFAGGGTGANYTYSWPTGGVATGAHTLTVKTSGNGCSGVTKTISITTH